uniref:ATP synthase complex subunit 8 n=1 Tax=Apostictopterus fuliginosus TaxID=2485974 RepID=A0A3G3C795_9NEOP|nr:ATP synthase F0 subunit 8 [Apostictopterus fuliginosus]AYP72701.1 ATP synthase F0 subunit 8 [Apostictopterus fuliginosus]WGM81120.1 ATP synthase F0 subunit 8 [Pseudocoladenia dea]WGM81133.1 ATP synthase F0 subunit 8 [Pseudocoladenia fabia]
MPQMMPINWIISFIMFIMIFIMFNILNYFIFNKMIFSKKKKINFKKNILWKW